MVTRLEDFIDGRCNALELLEFSIDIVSTEIYREKVGPNPSLALESFHLPPMIWNMGLEYCVNSLAQMGMSVVQALVTAHAQYQFDFC